MAKWKLVRYTNKNEAYTFEEGEQITVGRGINNGITLTSIVISRNHCIIKFNEDHAVITDLKSSNGTYVGANKIPQGIPNLVKNLDLIGFGWTMGAPVINISENEKFVFQLIKEEITSIVDRLKFEDDTGDKSNLTPYSTTSPEQNPKTPCVFKRKLEFEDANCKTRKTENPDEVINISDSETEEKSRVIKEEPSSSDKIQIKFENGYLDYEAFNVKQEYLGSNEECIEIDSESDSDSENWLLRLSQNSPGKPFIKIDRKTDTEANNSYSQQEDFIDIDYNNGNNNINNFNEDDDIMHDIISIPPQPPACAIEYQDNVLNSKNDESGKEEEAKPTMKQANGLTKTECEVDGNTDSHDVVNDKRQVPETQVDAVKKVQIIEPLAQESKKRKQSKCIMGNVKDSPKSKKTFPQSNKFITESQKEERKQKLKDLAKKEKDTECIKADNSSTNNHKPTTKVKVTTLNRGAFLTDVQDIKKPTKRKESQKNKKTNVSTSETRKIQNNISNNDSENNLISERNTHKKRIAKKSTENKKFSSESKSYKKNEESKENSRLPLMLLAEGEKSVSDIGVTNQPSHSKENKKKVRFSEDGPKVLVFEIEPGNQMKKLTFIKRSLVDVQQRPMFSLEKITLNKILRWNPHWLEEQINNKDPPPILGHNNQPMSVLHSFVDHKHYIQLMGDLLLMEIWECLTVAYMKVRCQTNALEMRIESLPPVPSNDGIYDLYNLSVKITLHPNETRHVPKVGDILLVAFGPENSIIQRFFYVHNVRCLPCRPGNKTLSYNVSLHATYTDKMRLLQRGDVIWGKPLAYINKELTLFEAMEYLATSPLSEAILSPDSRHFANKETAVDITSQWTNELNPSQKAAVRASVAAAQSDRPSIQMVQGPPGTGKSSVICAIVMAYFYDSAGHRRHKRGKILICATSNAAVDELVLRLLNIRQKLPKEERFRMVRVGRTEAMHPRAFDVSSQQLALREANARQAEPQAPGLADEISHLEAKKNMWITAAQNATDSARIAYCESRIADLEKRMTLMRSGGARAASAVPAAAVERRIIEGADIVVTTLSSAYNAKMRGLKGRIALCIVDEAGQAIEPETLIPLTLGVTKITLIGDPQQLPGFICSQRAKEHGLGESLFFRLTSCAERWPATSPAVLLNEQYRMHPAIANYPNRAFYNGQIQTVAPARPKLHVQPYAIIGISSGDKGQGPSGANEIEAWGVSRLVLALNKTLRPLNLTVAVITPYNAHKELIKKNLKNMQEPGVAAVEVNTVDGFQGQERDVVVVSVARSHGVGFLTDAGRMNVMLTRARHALLVCLNPHALLKNYQWRTLIEDAQKRAVYRDLPNRLCRPASPGRSGDDSFEEILQVLR